MQIDAKPEDNLNEVLNMESEDLLVVNLPINVVYKQKVYLKRDNVVINGNNSTIAWDDHNGMSEGFGTADSATFTITSSHISVNNLSISNGFDYFRQRALRNEEISKGMGLQAVALYTAQNSDDVIFENCTFSGFQDTLFTDGIYNRFKNCSIIGNIDFIFGKAYSVFESCTVKSVSEGIVTAPSTLAESVFGLFFEDCDFICLDNVPDGSVYLARPWHPGGRPGVCSSFTAKNCRFGRHIHKDFFTTMKDSKGVIHYPSESRFSFF